MTVAEILEQVKTLNPEERKELAKLIIDTLDTQTTSHTAKTGAEIAAMLDEIDPIQFVDSQIVDPTDWVKAQRQKRKDQLHSYGDVE